MKTESTCLESIYQQILKDRGDDIKPYIESGYTFEEIFKLLYPDETLGTDVLM